MERKDARDIVLDALAAVAPEVDLGAIDPADELQHSVDLDSIDFLSIVTAVSEAIGADIPEHDYVELATLDGFVAYVQRRSVGVTS